MTKRQETVISVIFDYLSALTVWLIFAFSFLSCNEDTTPAWLQIDTINLETDEATEGANSHKITDAWVYMDNQPLGVFPLPCKIPVLAEGEHNFLIYAGVIENGISASRRRYPFYERHEVTLNLVKNETIKIEPTVKYVSNLNFALQENFESTGIGFIPTNISQTALEFVNKNDHPEIVKYGNSCGVLHLNLTDSIFKATTQAYFELPKNEPVYLELDYMSTATMTTGVILQNPGGFIEFDYIDLVPQDEATMRWTKMYLYLSEYVNYSSNTTSIEIYLAALLDAGLTSGVVYLDNIKIVHYQ